MNGQIVGKDRCSACQCPICVRLSKESQIGSTVSKHGGLLQYNPSPNGKRLEQQLYDHQKLIGHAHTCRWAPQEDPR